MRLLVGGSRAGKSTLAARFASATGLPVTFLATAEALDEDMEERIARHRAERPQEWTTIEEPIDLARVVAAAGENVVVLDCLTIWVSNLLLAGVADDEIERRAEEVAAAAARRRPATFVVTNEVGLGVHPPSDLGRRFRDVLGRVNSIWASHADEVLLVVAGRALRLEPVEP